MNQSYLSFTSFSIRSWHKISGLFYQTKWLLNWGLEVVNQDILLALGKLHKVFSISFEKFGRGVNRVVTEWEWKWLTPEFWETFGEILNICGELVRKIVHLWVVGMGCKIDH